MGLEHASDLQRKMYEFIVSYTKTEGKPPTIREICQALAITSTSHVNHHLKMLEKYGWISREGRKSRGIKLTKQSTGIPVKGTIAAGSPLDIFPDVHTFIVHQPETSGDDVFALRVKGRSMIEDAICDGDYVIIKPQLTCENGDVVVATHLQEGVSGSATLKRFFLERDQVRLQPANSEMEPISVPKEEWDREWEVQGKVVAILRHYDPYLNHRQS